MKRTTVGVAHEASAVGLNYWLSSEFVLKATYKHINGNRFAVLGDEHELEHAFEDGHLDPKTNVFQFGAQFSF